MAHRDIPLPPVPDLTMYLARTGWSTDSSANDRFALWHPSVSGSVSGSNLQIVLPPPDAIDPEQQVEEAIRALTVYERRDRREVVGDIACGGADSVSIRLTPDAPSGEAPLGQMRRTIVALHDYVLGSASSLHTDSVVLPSNRPPEAVAYADAARASTTSGSLIIQLALPLANANDLPEVVTPYGRRVTTRMREVAERSTELARRVGSGKAPLSSFRDRQQSRANATEIGALAALSGTGDTDTYGLRFSGTPLYRDEPLQPLMLRVSAAEQEVLLDAAKLLREQAPQPDVELQGTVVRLHRTKAYGPGDVTIFGVAPGDTKAHHYLLNLGEDDYNQAAFAHPNGLPVVARGSVHLRGRRRVLRAITEFTVDYREDDRI